MKLADSRIKNSLSVLFSIVILSITASDRAQAAEAPIGRYVFEYCHSGYGNAGSLQTHDGFFIDNEGAVWSYDHGDYQWKPRGNDGLYEYDLYDKYGNVKQVGTVDMSVLSAMASLIEPASRGETNQIPRVAGMDSMSYIAYLHEPGQGMYKEVLLSVRGSGALQNTSGAAKTLVPWLESVFSPNVKSNPPEPVRSGVPHPIQDPTRGTVTPKLGIIQKIPAPKPQIERVEITGPFPVEDRSK
jgi:hypothetical protein